MRPSLQRFAAFQETILQNHDHKPPWSGETFSYLLECLKDEVKELEEAMINQNPTGIALECADIANFAMMIYDNSQSEKGV